MEKRLIHINSYYGTNGLHREFVKSLSDQGWKNYVFVKKLPDPVSNTNFYSLSTVHGVCRLIYLLLFTSHNVYCASLVSNYLPFSPLLHLRKRVSVVSVRNTDLNYYSERIPFIFEVVRFLQNNTQTKFHVLSAHAIEKVGLSKDKTLIVPNGISHFWLANVYTEQRGNGRFIFVGRLDRNKNVLGLVELFSLRQDLHLTIVGDGPLLDEVVKKANGFENIEVLGRVMKKERLMRLYRESTTLIMLSRTESFGLVYLEALSQGCNIVYTQGQGFDGWLSSKISNKGFGTKIEEVGKYLDDLSIWRYVEERVLTHYIDDFSWAIIGKKWNDIYEE